MSCETSRNVPPAKDVVKRDTIVERWMNKTFTHTPSGKDDVTKREERIVPRQKKLRRNATERGL